MVYGACQTTMSSAGLETTDLGRGVSAAAEATPCEGLWDKGDTSEHDVVKEGEARSGRRLGHGCEFGAVYSALLDGAHPACVWGIMRGSAASDDWRGA